MGKSIEHPAVKGYCTEKFLGKLPCLFPGLVLLVYEYVTELMPNGEKRIQGIKCALEDD